jgi:hypothetical protein
MMDAAHHMPTTEVLGKAFEEMDRVTRPDGLVVVMDLVRLRTRELTENYIELLAHDYIERGLPNFVQDFRDSMYAAWTPAEMVTAVPSKSKRRWSQLVPRGLPFAQFLIGFPVHRRSPLRRRDSLWTASQIPVTAENRGEYRLAKLTMAAAAVKQVGSTPA